MCDDRTLRMFLDRPHNLFERSTLLKDAPLLSSRRGSLPTVVRGNRCSPLTLPGLPSGSLPGSASARPRVAFIPHPPLRRPAEGRWRLWRDVGSAEGPNAEGPALPFGRSRASARPFRLGRGSTHHSPCSSVAPGIGTPKALRLLLTRDAPRATHAIASTAGMNARVAVRRGPHGHRGGGVRGVQFGGEEDHGGSR